MGTGRTGEPAEESEERKTWIWLGGYVQSLAPVVEAYLNSTDPAKRLHAFNRLDKYRSKRSDGDYAGRRQDDATAAESCPQPRPAGREADNTPRRRVAGTRTPSDGARGSGRRRAARRWKRLLAPSRPGRPTKAESARLDLLAEAVREMRRRKHTLAAIGAAIRAFAPARFRARRVWRNAPRVGAKRNPDRERTKEMPVATVTAATVQQGEPTTASTRKTRHEALDCFS